jgi:transposase
MPKQVSSKKTKTLSFVTEIPLVVSAIDEGVLVSKFEAGRQLYNACLGEAMRRLRLVKQSKLYQSARKIKSNKKERLQSFAAANAAYGYDQYSLHAFATIIRRSWIGFHIDSNTAQKLATRAFNASQKVAFGIAKKVRFKGKNQLDSLEGKVNTTGIRWHTEQLVWGKLKLQPYLKNNDPVILHGLASRIKYVRLVRRRFNNKTRYYAQLVCEGKPFTKPKNQIGFGVVGLDIGPSTIAIVGESAAKLDSFAPELNSVSKQIRQLQRKMERSKRANNPNNYNPDFVDAKGKRKKGTVKKGCQKWNESKTYHSTRRAKANLERKLAAHRKSLHGRLAHEILRVGNTIKLEKLSYKAFQKLFGKSVGKRAPGEFVSRLKRLAESAGVTAIEFSTFKTKLSQTCHQCRRVKKKSLSTRIHKCECGVLCQRDLYSAFLARFVENDLIQVDLANVAWSGAQAFLMAAWRQATEENNLRLGGQVPSSFGKPPESERVATKVLIPDTEILDAVPSNRESQEEVESELEPPSL